MILLANDFVIPDREVNLPLFIHPIHSGKFIISIDGILNTKREFKEIRLPIKRTYNLNASNVI